MQTQMLAKYVSIAVMRHLQAGMTNDGKGACQELLGETQCVGVGVGGYT